MLRLYSIGPRTLPCKTPTWTSFRSEFNFTWLTQKSLVHDLINTEIVLREALMEFICISLFCHVQEESGPNFSFCKLFLDYTCSREFNIHLIDFL